MTDSFHDVVAERRTIKNFTSEPVPREQLECILATARWAPNHRMTEPWRFRVLGPEAVAALKTAAGPGAEKKLDRARTLVAASYVPSPLPLHATEDAYAAACAVYLTLLAAHDDGLASYWRTPAVLRTSEGRAACGMESGEIELGLLHFGWPANTAAPEVPERKPVDEFVTWLD
ncbi:MAG: nitroreductase family protein [Thermoleophilia bacterium]|nr:nitroreductase family protein [Thermoleophilia bacterium]